MADTPAIERGAGGDPNNEPLQQGDATKLNEAAAAVPESQRPAQSPQLPPDAFSVPTPTPPGPQAASDEEKYLLGPPRQGEPISASAPSSSAGGGLGLLDEAAMDPTAPPQVALLRNLLADLAERG